MKGTEVDRAGEDLVVIYLDVLNGQEDATLQCLSLQGLSHFVGVRFSDSELVTINESIICLLKRPTTADNVVDNISQFFSKMAGADERWVIEKVIPQLFDMTVLPESGKNTFIRFSTVIIKIKQSRFIIFQYLMNEWSYYMNDFKLITELLTR